MLMTQRLRLPPPFSTREWVQYADCRNPDVPEVRERVMKYLMDYIRELLKDRPLYMGLLTRAGFKQPGSDDLLVDNLQEALVEFTDATRPDLRTVDYFEQTVAVAGMLWGFAHGEGELSSVRAEYNRAFKLIALVGLSVAMDLINKHFEFQNIN